MTDEPIFPKSNNPDEPADEPHKKHDLPQFVDDDNEEGLLPQKSVFPSQEPVERVPVSPSRGLSFDFGSDLESDPPKPEATFQTNEELVSSVDLEDEIEIAETEEETLGEDDAFDDGMPQFIDPLEDDVQHFLEVTGALEEPAPQPTPTRPPQPKEQSTFVNPAMARVAASRQGKAPRDPGELWLAFRTLLIVSFVAVVVAFIFNYWTPDSFLSKEFIANLQEVSSTQGPPTSIPSPLPTFETVKKVGIITGHSGPPLNPEFEVDPGAVCDENFDNIPELQELDINTSVSQRVARLLIQAGYEVELLNEWDPRIDNYRASALISIHTNTCENLGFGATGFNVKAYESSPMIDRDNKLVDCLVARYGNATGLARHFGSPPDLADYHAFRQVSLDTPTVIIELGFMFSDRTVLTQQPDAMAEGIFEGIDCFLGAPSIQVIPTLTPTPPA